MSVRSLSPDYRRRSRSHSPGRSHYRSHKRSYSPGERSSSPYYKTSHHSVDRYETEHYESYRRPYMRFPPNRPFFDRGRGRGMRRPLRGFANRNFRFNPRYRGQYINRGGHRDRTFHTSPSMDRSKRRSFTPSPSRSRLRSQSPLPSRRRSVTPEPKRRLSRSRSPSVTSSASIDLSKSPPYKPKDMKEKEPRFHKQPKDKRHSGKGLHGSSISGRSKSPDDNWSTEAKPSFKREDLEKITVDVQCNVVQEPSPIVREIINPDEIKIVRRVGEGHKPLFERDEIQNSAADFDDENTGRSVSVKGDTVSERQDDHIYQASGTKTENVTRVSLSKRWERDDGSSSSSSSYTKKRKRFSEERDLSPVFDSKRSVSPSRGTYSRISSVTDQDLHRKNGRSYSRHSSGDLGDLRHSLSSRHKEDMYSESRQKYSDHSDVHHTSSTTLRKHYNDEVDRSRSRSPPSTYESQMRGRSEGHLPDYSQRTDRFKYSSWTDKPERDYGGTRPFRPRGFRSSRFFRPRAGGYVPRSNGTYTTRRPFRSMTGYIPRNRGYSSR